MEYEFDIFKLRNEKNYFTYLFAHHCKHLVFLGIHEQEISASFADPSEEIPDFTYQINY